MVSRTKAIVITAVAAGAIAANAGIVWMLTEPFGGKKEAPHSQESVSQHKIMSSAEAQKERVNAQKKEQPQPSTLENLLRQRTALQDSISSLKHQLSGMSGRTGQSGVREAPSAQKSVPENKASFDTTQQKEIDAYVARAVKEEMAKLRPQSSAVHQRNATEPKQPSGIDQAASQAREQMLKLMNGMSQQIADLQAQLKQMRQNANADTNGEASQSAAPYTSQQSGQGQEAPYQVQQQGQPVQTEQNPVYVYQNGNETVLLLGGLDLGFTIYGPYNPFLIRTALFWEFGYVPNIVFQRWTGCEFDNYHMVHFYAYGGTLFDESGHHVFSGRRYGHNGARQNGYVGYMRGETDEPARQDRMLVEHNVQEGRRRGFGGGRSSSVREMMPQVRYREAMPRQPERYVQQYQGPRVIERVQQEAHARPAFNGSVGRQVMQRQSFRPPVQNTARPHQDIRRHRSP